MQRHLQWRWLVAEAEPGVFAFSLYSHASLQRAELEADYSCVRASVRPSVPLLGEAQNLWFRTILSDFLENHLCILQYLATVAFKTQHKNCDHANSHN